MLSYTARGTVSVTPGTVSTLEGTSAILRCTASRSVTSFIWNYLNSVNGPLPAQATTTDISSIQSELTVTSVSNSNTGTYFCTGVFPPNGERSTDLAVISIQGELRFFTKPFFIPFFVFSLSNGLNNLFFQIQTD